MEKLWDSLAKSDQKRNIPFLKQGWSSMNGGRYAVLFFRCHWHVVACSFFWQKKHMPKKYVCKKTYYVLSVCIWCMGWRVGPGPDIPEFMLGPGGSPPSPPRIRIRIRSVSIHMRTSRERLEPPNGIPEFVALKSGRWNQVNTHDDSFFWTAPHAGFFVFFW